MNAFWCNGHWLEGAEFPVLPLDRGMVLGLSVFETLLGLNGRAVFVERHLARLAVACERLGWVPPQTDFGDLAAVMADGLQRVHGATGRARIRLTVTAGSGPFTDLTAGRDRRVWLLVSPAEPAPETMAVTISPWPRNERGALAGLKCASYAENLVALDCARRGGFDETLFFNTADELCEAATANVFLVKNGVLLTPPLTAGCLAGVTREGVLGLARQAGIATDEATLKMADLAAADEVFLTSATRGPVPVSRVNQRQLPASPIGNKLRALWQESVTRD
jgi:branched-subunit amino acid aminotransferase/4-amino-4-deoxychorismate lyase